MDDKAILPVDAQKRIDKIMPWRRMTRRIPYFAVLTLSGACSQPTRTVEIADAAPSAAAEVQAVISSEPTTETTRPSTGRQAASARLPSEDDAERWLFVLEVAKGVDGGLATGSFDEKGNKIRIHTEGVKRFSMDLSRLPIDWKRLVVIRINGVASELRKRKHAVLHWVKDERGRWGVVEP